MLSRLLRAMIVLSVFLMPVCAQGGLVLSLSDVSSDDTPAELLQASMGFSLAGGLLTLSVTNETEAPNAFDINSVYFNAAAEIDGLIHLNDDQGWTLLDDQKAGGFGEFDFALFSGRNAASAHIEPGMTTVFEFQVLGNDPIDEFGFVSEFSELPPGSQSALGAVKFVHGPNDDSAFGAVVPDPGTLALLGVPLVLSVFSRRRDVAHI